MSSEAGPANLLLASELTSPTWPTGSACPYSTTLRRWASEDQDAAGR